MQCMRSSGCSSHLHEAQLCRRRGRTHGWRGRCRPWTGCWHPRWLRWLQGSPVARRLPARRMHGARAALRAVHVMSADLRVWLLQLDRFTLDCAA